jgi:hypothetical protein
MRVKKKYSKLLGFRSLSTVPSSEIWKTQRFGSCICFHPQVRGEAPTLLCPLERANLNHWTQKSRCLSLHLRTEKDPVSKSRVL